MKKSRTFIAIIFMFLIASIANAEEDINLFSVARKADAYISINDELTIFLWSGKPVAYLEIYAADEYHVYGFNGKHLGWFISGVIHDHQGNAVCAVKEVLRNTDTNHTNRTNNIYHINRISNTLHITRISPTSSSTCLVNFFSGRGRGEEIP